MERNLTSTDLCVCMLDKNVDTMVKYHKTAKIGKSTILEASESQGRRLEALAVEV